MTKEELTTSGASAIVGIVWPEIESLAVTEAKALVAQEAPKFITKLQAIEANNKGIFKCIENDVENDVISILKAAETWANIAPAATTGVDGAK